MRDPFLVIVALMFATACGTDPACIEGASLACACPDGRTGAQICTESGRLGRCVCESPDTDAGTVQMDAALPADAAASAAALS